MRRYIGAVKIEIDKMKEGDVAGLSVFQDPYAYIAIKMIDGQKKIVYGSQSLTDVTNNLVQEGAAINQSTIYLRAIANYLTSKVNFYYSLDNVNYTKFGNEFEMKYDLSVFTGNKFAIFNYSTQSLG